MPKLRIRLVIWNEAEAAAGAKALRTAGFTVEARVPRSFAARLTMSRSSGRAASSDTWTPAVCTQEHLLRICMRV